MSDVVSIPSDGIFSNKGSIQTSSLFLSNNLVMFVVVVVVVVVVIVLCPTIYLSINLFKYYFQYKNIIYRQFFKCVHDHIFCLLFH